MDYITVTNNTSIPFKSIPVTGYENFMDVVLNTLMKKDVSHCVNYYGIPAHGGVQVICCMANDTEKVIHIASSLLNLQDKLPSLAAHNYSFEKFEREIHENFGISYTDHPWLKPVRYAGNRNDKLISVKDYPFYSIESEELHEVGVGPVHAGIIEPGHFRFVCNGEQILHLEIQLGYQHRGIESLFLKKKKLIELVSLSESIAGDTTIGHSLCFTNMWESLCGYTPAAGLQASRTIALEHERIAVHTGDLSALCTDIAYQLGSSVLGRLRTPLINYFQIWCGNRLAKGMIRPGKTNFPFTLQLAEEWGNTIEKYVPDFREICNTIFDLPSVLARFERTGVVSPENADSIGVVGMAARSVGINRDIRSSHPHDFYKHLPYDTVTLNTGDVYARAKLRELEIEKSISYIRDIIKSRSSDETGGNLSSPAPDSFAVSLVEGWRGEICHCAITDSKGDLFHYKVKDPSFHNWLALALSVRNNEISDFPVCNKSFNLSYCGHDL